MAYLVKKPGSQHWGLRILCDLEIMQNVSIWVVKEPLKMKSTLAVTTLTASIERRRDNDVSRLLHKFYKAIQKWLLEHVDFIVYFVEILVSVDNLYGKNLCTGKLLKLYQMFRVMFALLSCHSNNNKFILLSGTSNIVLNIYTEHSAIYSAQ